MSKAKDENKRLNRMIVIMLALIAVVVICTTFFILKTPQAGLFSQPEQRAPVEVVEKNIDRRTSSGSKHRRSSTIFSYRISFRFPDGTVKKFEADKFVLSGVRKEAPYSSVYAGINEGETGLLTYKELEPAEIERWGEIAGRKFIHFKQDTAYGGKTFRWIDRSRTRVIFAIGFSFLLFSAVMFFTVYAFRYHKQILKSKEQRKLLIRERAEQQAAEQRIRSQEERQRRQARDEQQQKRKRQKQRQKRQRKEQRK